MRPARFASARTRASAVVSPAGPPPTIATSMPSALTGASKNRRLWEYPRRARVERGQARAHLGEDVVRATQEIVHLTCHGGVGPELRRGQKQLRVGAAAPRQLDLVANFFEDRDRLEEV